MLCSQTKLSPRNKIQKILNQCKIGDWFILFQLSKNINSLSFNEIIFELESALIINQNTYIRSSEYY